MSYPPEAMREDLTTLSRENAALRARVAEMHRRAQAAESAIGITIADCRREGVSLGRSLANAGYRSMEERAEKAEARVTGLRAALETYTCHLDECDYWSSEDVRNPNACTCGLSRALEDDK